MARLATRFGWSLVIEVLNLFTSAFIFIVLAQYISLEDYGRLGGLTAVAAIVGPIATFGSVWRLLRNIVVTKEPTRDLGLALSVTTIGTSVAILLVTAVAPAVVPEISRTTVAIYLLGQLTAFWLVELAITYTVALGQIRLGALIRIAASVMRFVGLGIFILLDERNLANWAIVTAVSGAGAAVAAHGVLALRTRSFPIPCWPRTNDYREGLTYAFGSTTEGFLAASDRPILLHYRYDAAAGFYAAGYRLVSLGFIPLMALLKANDRPLFKAGALGIGPAMKTGRHIAKLATAVTTVVSVALFFGAPLMAKVLPSSFAESADVVRLLAPLPMIKGIQFSFGNVLTAAGFQSQRLRLTVVATVVNLVGNLIFIPDGSWTAAAGTTLGAETLLAILVYLACHRLEQR